MTQTEPHPVPPVTSGPFAALDQKLQVGGFVTVFVTRTDGGLSVVLHGSLGDTQPLLERGTAFDAQIGGVFEQLARRTLKPSEALLEQVRDAPTAPDAVSRPGSAVAPPPVAVQEMLSAPRGTRLPPPPAVSGTENLDDFEV